MTSKHRRDLIAALEARGTRECVNVQALTDAMRDAGLAVCRVGYVADLKEALADLLTAREREEWPVEGRDACLRRVEALLGNGRVDDTP